MFECNVFMVEISNVYNFTVIHFKQTNENPFFRNRSNKIKIPIFHNFFLGFSQKYQLRNVSYYFKRLIVMTNTNTTSHTRFTLIIQILK